MEGFFINGYRLLTTKDFEVNREQLCEAFNVLFKYNKDYITGHPTYKESIKFFLSDPSPVPNGYISFGGRAIINSKGKISEINERTILAKSFPVSLKHQPLDITNGFMTIPIIELDANLTCGVRQGELVELFSALWYPFYSVNLDEEETLCLMMVKDCSYVTNPPIGSDYWQKDILTSYMDRNFAVRDVEEHKGLIAFLLSHIKETLHGRQEQMEIMYDVTPF